MDDRSGWLTRNMELNLPASHDALMHLQQGIGFPLPSDYCEFMLGANGGEGGVGNNAYLALWTVEEIVPLNEGYGVCEFAPGLVLFGSDGGDTAYGFDTRENPIRIVEVPFLGMDLSEVKVVSKSFVEFLTVLADT